MQTVNGIELELNKSKFIYEYENMKFYFSSELYMNKFILGIEDFIKAEKIKIFNKYKIRCNFNKFLALSYYKKIEKRGFYVVGYDAIEIKENIVIDDIY